MVLNLATATREEIKEELVEAVIAGNVLAARVCLGILEEMITEEGFRSIEEINEYYQVKRLINAL